MFWISIIISIISGVFCFKMAKEKNREPCAWLVFGLVLPLIAVIAISVSSTKQVQREEAGFCCPECGCDIQSEEKYCPNCGVEFDWSENS